MQKKDKEITWIERNSRSYLKDILPLTTPLSIVFEPTRLCNLKCIYCSHGNVNIDKTQCNYSGL
jgi:sulfatase maturation enzyme AslB (radical SAM superfamily)